MSKAKTIIVVGASTGIGAATSRRLLEQGNRVIGLGRQFDETLSGHDRFHAIRIDLAKLAELPSQYQQLKERFPCVDAILCNAGYGRFGALEQFSTAQIERMFNVNFLSHVFLMRVYVPLLKQQKQGDIIFIGSEAALSGSRNGAVYCASKFALRGFAQALREECSAAGLRITVINPGMVKTPFFDDLDFEPGTDAENFLVADDVANAVLFVLAQAGNNVIDEINLSPLKKVISKKIK